MLHSPPSLLNDPTRSRSSRDAFKRVHNASRLTCHTIPYHKGLCLPYNNTHHKNHTYEIGLSTCIESCMCSSFRQAPYHGAYVFHARSTSGICICQLRLEQCKTRSLGHSCFWSLAALFITWRWKFPNRSKTAPKPPNAAGIKFRKTNRANQ